MLILKLSGWLLGTLPETPEGSVSVSPEVSLLINGTTYRSTLAPCELPTKSDSKDGSMPTVSIPISFEFVF